MAQRPKIVMALVAALAALGATRIGLPEPATAGHDCSRATESAGACARLHRDWGN